LFVRGTDATIRHEWFSGGGYSGWESLGGTFTSAPAVAAMDNDHLDVYGTSTNGHLFHKGWTNETGWPAGWDQKAGAPPVAIV
jgi:hypothetical protein